MLHTNQTHSVARDYQSFWSLSPRVLDGGLEPDPMAALTRAVMVQVFNEMISGVTGGHVHCRLVLGGKVAGSTLLLSYPPAAIDPLV